ncbi:MAG: transporter substrate-binding domain-containing protein [Oscillospiraceae bacterium]|nr:transporter substrate-binding domain-containing protein [Oscillospiraceae bacterium]
MKKTNRMRMCALLLSLLMVFTALSTAALAADQKTVSVGWFYQPGYQELDADGNPGGYNYEFLLALAEKTGWTLDFVVKNQNGDELTWEDSLSMLASGDLDLMGCLLFSEERTSQYDFSTLAAGQTFTSLFVRDDSPIAGNDFAELNGISVAANTATLNDEDLTSFAKDSGFSIGEYQDCGDLQDVIDAVLEGSADAGVMASYQPVENTRVIASFAPRSFYFATTKGNQVVLSALNEGMNSILIQDP